LEIEWAAGTWTDESAYVVRVQAWVGFRFGDQVADAGRAEVVLDNAGRRFSPGNSSSPLYGLLLPRKRCRLKSGSTVVWSGFIERIEPSAGEWGADTCLMVAVDGAGLLGQPRVSAAYEDALSVPDAVESLVNSVLVPPGTDYRDNGDVLTHYGRTMLPESMTVREALRDVCETVYGRFWFARDGTATFWSRAELQNNSGSLAMTVSASDPVKALDVDLDVARVVNQVQVTVFPVETLLTTQVLWQAQAVLRLAPGETRTIYGLYRDPNGERCGALDVVDPVAATDYTVNERRDGSGPDYTTDPAFALTTVHEATRTAFTLSNSATGPLFVTKLQVRGRPLVAHDPITVQHEDTSSQAAYEVRARALRLPMQADPDLALNYGQYLVGRYAQPVLAARRLTVKNLAAVGGVDPLSLEIMSKVSISEPQSGLANARHWVTGLEYEVSASGWEMTAHLERADESQYWLLGRTGWSELGTATRLGF